MQVSKMSRGMSITIFTDGSCHNRLKSGGWAAIIFIGDEKVTLKGSEHDTTHHRMELIAVLEALRFLQKKNLLSQPITIYSDSQYVVDLLQRQERLTASGYKTKRLTPIRNADLVQSMVYFFNATDLEFVKLKSHLKSSDPNNVLNREVDMLSRQMMRTSA